MLTIFVIYGDMQIKQDWVVEQSHSETADLHL